MTDEEKTDQGKETPKRVNEVILRTYPKIVFFYPLFFISIILWIIQLFFPDPLPILGAVWMIVFALNVFVTAFDFNSAKFFILLLVIVVVVLLLVFLVPWADVLNLDFSGLQLDISVNAIFYLFVAIILGLTLLFVVISVHFDYWKVERNEIYHKSGIFSNAERFPVASLIYQKKIPDVFEFLVLRAGSITLNPSKRDIIHLNTVLNINKKAQDLDYLLSHLEVEVDELDL